MISTATQRSIFRWIHIIFGIPILGSVYSPFEEIPNYARCSVSLRSCNCAFGTLDVERPCPSTIYFEKIGLTLIRPPGVKRTNFTVGLEKQKTADELFATSTTIPIDDCPSF